MRHLRAQGRAWWQRMRGLGRDSRREQEMADEIEKLQRQYADRIPRPPLSMLIDQIDHIAKVAGVDHVGLGSDFDGVSGQ